MMRARRGFIVLLASLLVGLLWGLASTTGAYEFYSDPDNPGSGNCSSCHPGFLRRGPLHDAHTSNATGTCKLCHISTGDIPMLGFSGDADTPYGCGGCHSQPLASGGRSGAGLRLHHKSSGVVCATCHPFDPAPRPENIAPAYYARTDVVQKDPCNSDGAEDFWGKGAVGTPDGLGLDNDGDLLYDGLQDPDCPSVSCVDADRDGYGDPGDPSCPNGPARDCDDAHADSHPGAVEMYDQRDNDCDGITDEIEGVGFADPQNRQRLTWSDQLPAGQLYDVIRSDRPAFPAASTLTVCLELAIPFAFADDPTPVPLASALYYLVRNTLVVDYGVSSDGTVRSYPVCP